MSENEETNIQSEEESSTDSSDYSTSDDGNSSARNKKPRAKKRIFVRRSSHKMTADDLSSPEKINKIIEDAHEQVKQLQAKVRATQQINRRLQGQVVRLKNLVKHLKTVHR